MQKPDLVGYITLRVPIRLIKESESWEIPEVYTYLQPGEPELVSHDIPAAWHERLREELEEGGGIEVGQWGPEELAATTTLSEHPLPTEPPLPSLDLFSLLNAGQ
ncbi:hypothetical protein IV500_04745 [Paeniglutamicibacter antarcticus]|uniref:Uncharacterized protein n=1 Tax=Arthrobacter terrae TaxID=2935737 RepID=A0A931CMP9_9MICC|nr:hypothetical protein [Arthrobacter terrae]MBG0738726.1 hypothetical protein [Arthrobacter terrae]